MYRFVLFDLDGTLTDSREGIFNSVRYSLDKLDGPARPTKRCCALSARLCTTPLSATAAWMHRSRTVR